MEIEQLDSRSLKKEARRLRVMNTRSYRLMSKLTQLMDKYYVDPILGLMPGGWGDTISAVMIVPFVWFSLFVVKSVPLTLAVIYNALKDIVMGLIPFFVGDILDVFSHSYVRNMALIQGFIDDDRSVVREVNRKSWFFAGAILLCIAIIVLLIKLTVVLISSLFS
ncbi:MAG: DUF4112 domain-containing protein [Prevotella sp.]|nr:DUF4112 domain-containing protein [Prevotella sp.]